MKINNGFTCSLKRPAAFALLGFLIWRAAVSTCAAQIVVKADAAPTVTLAAKEIRRYVYLRTGELLPIAADNGTILLQVDAALKPQQYRLESDGKTLSITGGSGLGVLYGAYDFVGRLGVRFYLHGDVIPDEPIAFRLPVLNETHQPLFELRGVNPWGSHPFGFDAWSADDYKAIFSQLAKMRMNFLGLHCYGGGYAEPTVWHGLPGDFDADGRVKSSYVSRYYNTLFVPAWGKYQAKRTGDYSFGGASLFERDDWSPPALEGYCPLPETPAACNDVFNRTAAQFRDAFTFARQLGVKTCVGTEVPLVLPKALAQRTQDRLAVYEGTFRRIMASHPLDYYWLWTPERWMIKGNSAAQYAATIADIKLAIEAWRNVKAPFQLATAGWVLSTNGDRTAYDRDLPKNIAISALSGKVGFTEVDPAFGRIQGRDKWAIPWLESDTRNGLAGIQLFAGRVRRDAADALAYGCTGLMGLHWRTEIVSPNIGALAKAGWDQPSLQADPGAKITADRTGAPWPRGLPCDDFYADWARSNFGQAEIGRVFAAIDGKVPMVTTHGDPVGSLSADATPWATVARRFVFVDQLGSLRSRVHGAGNLERFDYWLNTFKYYRSLAHLRCMLAAPDPAALTRLWSDTYRYLLESVNTPGGLATVVTMENNSGWGPLIAKSATQPWPKEYQGKPRLIVPTVRSIIDPGEALNLKIIALARQPVSNVTVKFRPLGAGQWKAVQATPLARAVYRAKLPPTEHEDVEYYVMATLADGETLHWPVTAPALNQTVVVMESGTP